MPKPITKTRLLVTLRALHLRAKDYEIDKLGASHLVTSTAPFADRADVINSLLGAFKRRDIDAEALTLSGSPTLRVAAKPELTERPRRILAEGESPEGN